MLLQTLRSKSVYFYLLCILVLSAVHTQAENSTCRFGIRHLHDTPQNDVNTIYKDRNGFIWIGTLDGLFRYDGYSYKEYRVSDEKNNLSSNLIIKICEDQLGNIWVATFDKGICRLNPDTEQITCYQNTPENPSLFNSNDVNTMIIDRNNIIWTGNWYGVNRIEMDEQMEKIIHVEKIASPSNTSPNGSEMIQALLQDKNDNIWLGTSTKLYLFENPYSSSQDAHFKQFDLNGAALCESSSGLFIGGTDLKELVISGSKNAPVYTVKPIANDYSRDLLYQDDILWAGGENGLFVYKKDSNGKMIQVCHFESDYSDKSLSSNIVYCIEPDDYGQIWVGTRSGGINILTKNQKPFYHYHHTNDKGSIASNFCRSIFEDSHENLWIGTEEGGVSLLKAKKNKAYNDGFQHFTVNDIRRANRVYAIEELRLPHSQKHKSIIWLGTSNPQNLFALDGETFEAISLPPAVKDIGFIFAIEVQNDSTLWLGTYGYGLMKLKLDRDGEIKSFTRFQPDHKNPNSISSNIIRSILKDKKGNLWIGTDKGLNKLTPKELAKNQPKFTIYTKGETPGQLKHDYILQVFEASDGKIWIGTMGGGLFNYDENSSGNEVLFHQISLKDGLPNNSIKSIVEDERNNLWIATNRGLTKYNPRTKEITNYDVSAGLQDDEFAEICALRRKNGQVVFGGINGFNVFYPDQIKEDTISPKMFLTAFYVSNQKIEPGQEINGKVILSQTISKTKTIDLSFKENSFSIEFAALHYKSPFKNKYKYKLEGFDSDWIVAEASHRVAKYTNIPAGNYIFRVNGANSDNVWAEDEASLEIIIAPPFYRSTWAYFIYVLIIAIAIYINRRVSQIIRKRKKEILLARLEQKKTEEIAQMKFRFFTNISHEFKTPLTLIAAPLDKLIANNDSFDQDDRYKFYLLIKQNVNVMLRLINQLLDFRKLDQEKMKLRVERWNIVEFINSIYKSFELLAEKKNIRFNFEYSTPDIEAWIDADKLEKVIYNLLSNAFKFTPDGKTILIGLEEKREENKLIIYVKDTGSGIDKEEKPHVFERYYQTEKKGNKTSGGTGIGLSLSKGLVELHQGFIYFQTAINEGTTFFVELKLGKSHFTDDQIADETYVPQIRNTDHFFEFDYDDEKADHAANKRNKKILIAEDNDDLRLFLAEGFKNDFKVYDTDNGEEALELCKKHLPDLVISDVMMPKMNGIDLCHYIKSDETTCHIPVILLTARGTVESQLEGYKIGADNYLTKPFNFEVLKATVNSITKNRSYLQNKFQRGFDLNPSLIANTEMDQKLLEKLIRIIEENISDSEFWVENLAEKYGVSRIYLNRKIKALTGETTVQFMRNIRLKHAARLLEKQRYTVSEICCVVGYNDVKTFRKRFKEMFGVPPSEFGKGGEDEDNAKEED